MLRAVVRTAVTSIALIAAPPAAVAASFAGTWQGALTING
jgi:hypothetical protein